jgi:uncharacterized protein (DUF736 family)
MKKNALIIGQFTKTEHGFTGRLQTLGIDANITLRRNDDKQKDSHPDYTVTSDANDYEIGVAWDRNDDRGYNVSLAFEEPSLAPGYYTLVKTGVEKGYQLLYKKPMPKKEVK